MANALSRAAARGKDKRSGNDRTHQQVRGRPDQVLNNAGGFVYKVDDYDRLQRFLVLGTEGGTFYVRERKLTAQNAEVVMRCLTNDYRKTIDQIVRCSVENLAPKNDQALYALAMAASHPDEATRVYALAQLPKVARIGTHLFQFMEYIDGIRGRGRAVQRALQSWYIERDINSLQHQLVKYQSRGAWSHRDVLRVARPVPQDDLQASAFRWAVCRTPEEKAEYDFSDLSLIDAFEAAKTAKTTKALIKLIEDHRLSHEMLPSEALALPEVWEAMLPHMGLTALLRNLGRMTANGLLTPMSSAYTVVAARIMDFNELKRARVHPFTVMVAAHQYGEGGGNKGKLTWKPVPKLNAALDQAFHTAFGAVRPSNKRTMLAIDVSGSKTWDSSNLPGTPISSAKGAAAMAMVTHRTEPYTMVTAFSSGSSWRRSTSDDGLVEIDLSGAETVTQSMKKINAVAGGGTDVSLPMLYARKRNLDVETFVIYTDNETWAGSVKPDQALRDYRKHIGHDAKLIVVGMAATEFTVADPKDKGMLDVVGFDASAPNVMAEFSAGRL